MDKHPLTSAWDFPLTFMWSEAPLSPILILSHQFSVFLKIIKFLHYLCSSVCSRHNLNLPSLTQKLKPLVFPVQAKQKSSPNPWIQEVDLSGKPQISTDNWQDHRRENSSIPCTEGHLWPVPSLGSPRYLKDSFIFRAQYQNVYFSGSLIFLFEFTITLKFMSHFKLRIKQHSKICS